jgi:SnoaL-like domain
MLTADDRLAIRELLALYGHIIDERQFSRTHELFTPDARYDVSDFGQGIHHGPGAIAALWTAPGARHPLAHHTVDVIVSEDGDGTVRVLSKGIGLLADGRAGSVTYRDVVAKSAGGWRIAERVAVLRRADRIPEIS